MRIDSLTEAFEAQLALEGFLKRNGLRELVGDYGEALAVETLGGRLMPPTSAGHDLFHDHLGRVQVKCRRLAVRIGGRGSSETRAVLGANKAFDRRYCL